MKDLPKKYLNSEDKKEMWKEAKKIISKIDKALDLSEIHVIGSMASEKKNPDDIDFAIITKVKKSKAWPIDLIILPEDEDTEEYLEFFKKHMKKKYGSDSRPVKLK